jgi:hypothetical protein
LSIVNVGEQSLNPRKGRRNQPVVIAFSFVSDEEAQMADRKVIDTTESRQATPQKMNYRVLTRSLIGAAIAAVIVYAYFYMQSPV